MTRVLALLLDAASPDLLEKWMDDGSLPNLRRFRDSGAYGRLRSTADLLAEGAHFAFHTGRSPGATGLIGYSIWDPIRMESRTPTPDWLPAIPFWRSPMGAGPRAVVVDPANVYAPESFNGVEIVGWATHDTLVGFRTFPAELAGVLRRRYGAPLMPDEHYGRMTKRDFLQTIDRIRRINRAFEALCTDLMHAERWDLFLACNYTLHHAGHRLWDTANIIDGLTDAQQQTLQRSVREAYVDCDRALGRVVDAAGADVRVLAFSLHGMGANHSRTQILPEMLHRIVGKHAASKGVLKRFRERVPERLRHNVKSLLPLQIRRRLTSYWRLGGMDWEKTRAFCLLSDTEGWVRINLKGREARGIVEPGAEYETLLAEIADGLKTFVDADTGEPLVREIVRSSDHFQGAHMETLPDLIVCWSLSSAARHREIQSPQYGTIAWPTPGRNPEGRSGNHRSEGMLIASGSGVYKGAIHGGHILDLAPTILTLLGQPVPSSMEGKALHLFD